MDVEDFTRDLRDSTKEMERIKIREREISSNLEEKILYLLEASPKLEVRGSEMRRSGLRDIRKNLGQVDEEEGVVREAS